MTAVTKKYTYITYIYENLRCILTMIIIPRFYIVVLLPFVGIDTSKAMIL